MVKMLFSALRRRRVELLFVLSLSVVYFFTYFQRVAVPGTVFDQLQSDMSLSATAVAGLGAIYLYVYGGLQILCGMSIDRFGVLRIVLLGGVLLSLGSFLFPLSHSVTVLYATRALVGLGSSLVYLCIIKEIDVRFGGPNFSMVLSGALLVGYAGGLFGTRPFEHIVQVYGWRQGLLGMAGASLIALVCVAYFGRKTPDTPKSSQPPESLKALWHVFRNHTSYSIAIGNATLFAAYFVVQSTVGKKVLEDCFGLSSPAAASYTFILMLSAMASGMLAGFLSRLMGNRRRPIQLLGTFLATVALLAMAANLSGALNPGLALACYVVLGIATGANPMFICSMRELNRADSAATSVGVANSLSYLTVALMTTVAGLIQDAYAHEAVATQSALRYPPAAYRCIFILLGVVALCSLVCAVVARETRGQNQWREKNAH